MFRRRPPKTSALDSALLEAVTDAVPRGSASVESSWVRDARGWFVGVIPRRAEACPFSVGAHGREQVRFTVGRGTAFEVYRVGRPDDLGLVRRLLEAIVAGRVEEFGSGRRSFVRITLGRGDVFTGGVRARWRPWPLAPKGQKFGPFVSPEATRG